MLLTDRKMTGAALVRPASSDFWKAPQVTIFLTLCHSDENILPTVCRVTLYTACLNKSLLLIVIHLFVWDCSVKGSAENSSEPTENGNNQFK